MVHGKFNVAVTVSSLSSFTAGIQILPGDCYSTDWPYSVGLVHSEVQGVKILPQPLIVIAGTARANDVNAGR